MATIIEYDDPVVLYDAENYTYDGVLLFVADVVRAAIRIVYVEDLASMRSLKIEDLSRLRPKFIEDLSRSRPLFVEDLGKEMNPLISDLAQPRIVRPYVLQ